MTFLSTWELRAQPPHRRAPSLVCAISGLPRRSWSLASFIAARPRSLQAETSLAPKRVNETGNRHDQHGVCQQWRVKTKDEGFWPAWGQEMKRNASQPERASRRRAFTPVTEECRRSYGHPAAQPRRGKTSIASGSAEARASARSGDLHQGSVRQTLAGPDPPFMSRRWST
jgi:hypothetical protein